MIRLGQVYRRYDNDRCFYIVAGASEVTLQQRNVALVEVVYLCECHFGLEASWLPNWTEERDKRML